MPIINKENLNSTCKKIAYASAEMTIMMAQRTYYFDKQIINNLEVTKQIVFLGTGYDTRPKRFEKQFENLKVFEVTQTKKRQVTDKLNWPSNVQFVETDFNNDHLKKDLESEGYNPKLKTIFILDLYLYYRCYLLYSKRIFISNSLFIRENSGNGSLLLFDAMNHDPNNTNDIITKFLGNLVILIYRI